MPRVVLTLGDDISTDVIYPGRYMATVLPSETPQWAFADMAEFNSALQSKTLPQGSIIAACNNFGCGSSREQAVSALKGHELTIIAWGFARIFLQNAINLGLRLATAPGFTAAVGDEVQLTEREVINLTAGRSCELVRLPAARQEILDAGGLIPYTRGRLRQRGVTRQ